MCLFPWVKVTVRADGIQQVRLAAQVEARVGQDVRVEEISTEEATGYRRRRESKKGSQLWSRGKEVKGR